MPLNKQSGNMYGFVTHIWNPVKGICPHLCSYCYMRKWWPKMGAPRLDEKEFKINLGENRVIFVGSSIDMWADGTSDEWAQHTLEHIHKYPKNKYLFQTKKPLNMRAFTDFFDDNHTCCITLETNRHYKHVMGLTPSPTERYINFLNLEVKNKMITIEPIMDFDLQIFINEITEIKPWQVNIGADSKKSGLPEPAADKIKNLVDNLERQNIKIYLKPNLNRLLKE